MKVTVRCILDVDATDISALADRIIALSGVVYESTVAENAAISELLTREFQIALSDAYALGKSAA